MTVKVKSNFKKIIPGKKALKKKDTATIFKIEVPYWIGVEWSGFLQRWFDMKSWFWKLWPCLFFLTPRIFANGPLNFTFVWLWAAITPVQKLENPISYTFSEPSGRQLSHGGTLDIWCSNKISLKLTICKKLPVFAFFGVTPQKNFKCPPIGQYWRQRPSP